MKFSLFALIGGLVLVSVAQPSQRHAQGLDIGQVLPCVSYHTSADVLEIDKSEFNKPLAEWLGEGHAISVVVSDANQTSFTIAPSIGASDVCQGVYGFAPTL